jgi:2-polyprenyl-6-methoxyphenol hydroxylase-like FAD-dependent oxidoreductase
MGAGTPVEQREGQRMATPAARSWAPLRPLGHAVVIGGSIAGLLAARVLAGHFRQVTVLERDRLARTPGPRKGVPQGSHVHAVLVRGQQIMERLLPGLTAELCARGAVLLSAGRELAWHHAGGWRARHDSELAFLSMTRPLLEAVIAARVAALPNVTAREGSRVAGLLDDGKGRVRGVRVGPAGGARDAAIRADLVVDATGRGSAVPQRLAELGFDPPATESLPASVAYASCTFRQRAHGQGWRALIVNDAAAKRSGLLFPIEGGRWLVTLVGLFDQPMPEDHDAFLAFTRSLPVPGLHEAIRTAEPLSPIARFRFPGSQRHRYERLAQLPEGLIALGDAVCSFNPVYGQGMTVAAIEAELLGRLLEQARAQGGPGPDFARRWFLDIAPAVDAAWGGVTLEDLRHPELAQRRPLRLRLLQWYTARLHRATHRSAVVTDRFYRVMNFLAPPATLFRPRVLAAVLLGGAGAAAKPSLQPETSSGSRPPVPTAP